MTFVIYSCFMNFKWKVNVKSYTHRWTFVGMYIIRSWNASRVNIFWNIYVVINIKTIPFKGRCGYTLCHYMVHTLVANVTSLKTVWGVVCQTQAALTHVRNKWNSTKSLSKTGSHFKDASVTTLMELISLSRSFTCIWPDTEHSFLGSYPYS